MEAAAGITCALPRPAPAPNVSNSIFTLHYINTHRYSILHGSGSRGREDQMVRSCSPSLRRILFMAVLMVSIGIVYTSEDLVIKRNVDVILS